MGRIFKFFLFFLLAFLVFRPSFAQESKSNTTCIVYLTGLGCPHCAKTDPLILEKLPQKYPNLVVLEYEIYQQKENAPLLLEYNKVYNSGLGIPLVIFDKETFLVGDRLILAEIEKVLQKKRGNLCPLIDGTSVAFEKVDLSTLPGSPKIWTKDKMGVEVEKFQKSQKTPKLTLAKVLSLALADSVNPCALAVLTLMLLSIMSLGSKKRRDLLLAGLSFSFSVFLMYLFYGLVIIRFFQAVKALTTIRLYLYKILGLFAIILGVLNLKDFVHYRPGGFLTEMPMFLRPKLHNLFFKATSPKGALWLGALVTLFLLPCTIGPYIICGGILCPLSLVKALPWLFLYNLIFILPMVGITLICFLGLTAVENVSEWRQKNIRYLHLAAGLIILGLGVGMVLGWL